MRRYLSGRWRTRPSPDRFVAVRPCGFEGRVIGKTSRAYSASISQKAMAQARNDHHRRDDAWALQRLLQHDHRDRRREQHARARSAAK
jgi:hypothetical protein